MQDSPKKLQLNSKLKVQKYTDRNFQLMLITGIQSKIKMVSYLKFWQRAVSQELLLTIMI